MLLLCYMSRGGPMAIVFALYMGDGVRSWEGKDIGQCLSKS